MNSINRIQSPFQAELPSENFQPVTARVGEVTLSDATQRLSMEPDSQAKVSQPDPAAAADENQAVASRYSPVFGDPVASSAMQATLNAMNAGPIRSSNSFGGSLLPQPAGLSADPLTTLSDELIKSDQEARDASNSGAELPSLPSTSDEMSMLDLQSLVAQRQEKIQTASTIMQETGDDQSTIASNIKG